MEDSSNNFDEATRKLYIGGINPLWSVDEITSMLEKHGSVKRLDRVKNFAFAFVENQKTAEDIIKGVTGQTINGCKLVVQISKNKQNLLNVDQNVCFECGKSGHWAKECEQRLRRQGRDRDIGTYTCDPYSRDIYVRDSYERGPYYSRDPYAYSREAYFPAYEYSRYKVSRTAVYRERRPTSVYAAYRRAVSPARVGYVSSDHYAAARERVAYGSDRYESARRVAATIDPEAFESARRALDAVHRADPYGWYSADAPRYADAVYSR